MTRLTSSDGSAPCLILADTTAAHAATMSTSPQPLTLAAPGPHNCTPDTLRHFMSRLDAYEPAILDLIADILCARHIHSVDKWRAIMQDNALMREFECRVSQKNFDTMRSRVDRIVFTRWLKAEQSKPTYTPEWKDEWNEGTAVSFSPVIRLFEEPRHQKERERNERLSYMNIAQRERNRKNTTAAHAATTSTRWREPQPLTQAERIVYSRYLTSDLGDVHASDAYLSMMERRAAVVHSSPTGHLVSDGAPEDQVVPSL